MAENSVRINEDLERLVSVAIIGQAVRASYGRGAATFLDESVRKVWQLEPGGFSASAKRAGTGGAKDWGPRVKLPNGRQNESNCKLAL